MTQVRQAERKIKRSWWPLIGFLLIVSLAILSYTVAPDVLAFTQRLLPRLNTRSISPEMLRLIFAGLTWAVLVLIAGLIVAIFAPRRRSLVKETDVVKDRAAMLKEREDRKEQQRQVNLKVRREVKIEDPRTGKVE